MDQKTSIGITDMAERAGLSADTLRWYEREGLLPRVSRSSTGLRQYSARERDLVLLLAALRKAGMPTAQMRAFTELLSEGAVSHGRRVHLLQQTREQLQDQRRRLDQTAIALEDKIEHYEALIRAGLDCDGAPVPAGLRNRQTARL